MEGVEEEKEKGRERGRERNKGRGGKLLKAFKSRR